MKARVKLDKYEREIEKNAGKMVPVTAEEKRKILSILEKARKNISISLRINSYDLEKIKERAGKNGLPYQTLITIVLHKYVNEELYDKDEVMKTLRIMKIAV